MFGICVTKSDEEEQIDYITSDEMKEFQQYPQIFIHMNVSAKTGMNVQELFSAIAEIVSVSVKEE